MYKYVLKELKLLSYIQICVYIYINTKGLVLAYCYNKILDSKDNLYIFVCSFNIGYPIYNFVDASNRKEYIDLKLKGNVKAYSIYSSIIGERQYLTLTLA